MKRLKKLMHLLLAVFMCISISGCWDKVELENRGFVMSIGIDKGQNGKAFRVSLALPDVAALVGGSEKNKEIKTADGETISEALREIDSLSGKRLDYGNTKLCVISRDVLDDERLLRETIDALERSQNISKRIFVMTTDKSAKEILESKVSGESLVAMFVERFFRNKANTVLKNDLESIIHDLSFSQSTLVPKISLDDEELKIEGAAAVKDFKFSGWVDDIYMDGYRWLKQRAVLVTADYEGADIPLKITKNSCRQSFTYDGEKLYVSYSIKAEGAIEEFTFSDSPHLNEAALSRLSGLYEDAIYKQVVKTWEFFKNDIKTDGLNLKDALYKKNYSVYKALSPNWQQTFESAELVLSVDIKIRNTGAIK